MIAHHKQNSTLTTDRPEPSNISLFIQFSSMCTLLCRSTGLLYLSSHLTCGLFPQLVVTQYKYMQKLILMTNWTVPFKRRLQKYPRVGPLVITIRITRNSQRLEKCIQCVLLLYNGDFHIFFFLADYLLQTWS